jgi:hypothetical protein
MRERERERERAKTVPSGAFSPEILEKFNHAGIFSMIE